jgi:hypothetical protein
MKKVIVIFLICLFGIQCSAQNSKNVWHVQNVKTNYVPKGILDTGYYKPPKYLKGKRIITNDSILILTDIRMNYIASALTNEFSDTIILEKKVLFKKLNDDKTNKMYPGDEFIECVQHNNDTCFASESFFNLLGFKEDVINAYISPVGKHSKTKLILFLLKENKKVLYSENDFLLLFLSKNR